MTLVEFIQDMKNLSDDNKILQSDLLISQVNKNQKRMAENWLLGHFSKRKNK